MDRNDRARMLQVLKRETDVIAGNASGNDMAAAPIHPGDIVEHRGRLEWSLGVVLHVAPPFKPGLPISYVVASEEAMDGERISYGGLFDHDVAADAPRSIRLLVSTRSATLDDVRNALSKHEAWISRRDKDGRSNPRVSVDPALSALILQGAEGNTPEGIRD